MLTLLLIIRSSSKGSFHLATSASKRRTESVSNDEPLSRKGSDKRTESVPDAGTLSRNGSKKGTDSDPITKFYVDSSGMLCRADSKKEKQRSISVAEEPSNGSLAMLSTQYRNHSAVRKNSQKKLSEKKKENDDAKNDKNKDGEKLQRLVLIFCLLI